MNKEIFDRIIVKENLTLTEAMKKIDDNAKGILYVIDDSGKLSGSITDGDIRRWILSCGDLNCKVTDFMYRGTKYIEETEVGICDMFMRTNKISSVPVLDSDKKIVDVIFSKNYPSDDMSIKYEVLKNVPIIIMAGGKGMRLYPYTKILPKPLIPIGEIPILERILNRFYRYGAGEFYVTVNYKKEMIKSYFADINPSYILNYVEEDKPLGTAGSIRLIKETFYKPVIVTNCDILIDINYKKLMEYHVSLNNDMTIVSSLRNTKIPYGVIRSKENGLISSMQEKPELSYFINTGMYIINPKYFDWIPKDKMFHMTELANLMIEKSCRVGMYPVSENSFLDMGELEELKKMEKKINSGEIE